MLLVKLLEQFRSQYRRARRVVLILDNYRIHKSQMVERGVIGRFAVKLRRRRAGAAPRDEAQMQEDHFFGGGPLGDRGRELKAMEPWRVLDNRSV